MAWREQVAREKVKRYRDWDYWGRPVPGFGDPAARLLLVGLAPAAHGGNRTGRMFTGDSSGDWLYEALHRFGFASQAESVSRDDGLALTDCFITASARCAPPDNTPLPGELLNCRPWLVAELEFLKNVEVVVALGRIALETWMKLEAADGRRPSKGGPRFGHGEEWRMPDGRLLITSYHPSQQNTNTGKLTRPMWHAIFRRAREVLDGVRAVRPRARGSSASRRSPG